MTQLPIAPAPWMLQGMGYIFLHRTPFSETPISLPEGAFHPAELENPHVQNLSRRYHGGVGMFMLIRYASSDVGPYDEIIYLPGLFSRPETNPIQYFHSVTRIYVSTAASVANGRRNWGIPKHRALFSFLPTDPSRPRTSPLHVTVSLPGGEEPAFFHCEVKHSSSWIPSVPTSTAMLNTSLSRYLMRPHTGTLYQPMISDLSKVSKSNKTNSINSQNDDDLDSLVGTSSAFLVTPISKGWAKPAYLYPIPDSSGSERKAVGNGKDFPALLPYTMGVKLTFDMEFGIPVRL